MDPTIPRGPMVRLVTGPRIGKLVWKGDKSVWLTLDDGSRWAPGHYSIVQGFSDGLTNLPRPWRYNDSDEVVVEGDQVLVDFIQGSAKLPVVRGVVRKVGEKEGDLIYDYRNGHVGNEKRGVHVRRGDDGAEQGRVVWKLNESGGDVELSATQVVVKIDGVTLTIADKKLVISNGGTDEPMVLGLTFLSDLSSWLTAFATFLTSSAADSTMSPGVAAAATAMQTPNGDFLAKVSASTSAPGAPHLSTTSRTT